MTPELEGVQAIADALSEPTILVQLGGRIMLANHTARALGARPDMVLSDVFDIDQRNLQSELKRSARVQQPYYFSLSINHGDQSKRFRSEGSRLRLETGGAPLILLRLRAASQTGGNFLALNERMSALQRSLRYQRRRTNRLSDELKGKTLFIAEFGHELRSPLNAVIGFSSMIHDILVPRGDSEKIREYSDLIGKSARHLLTVISNLLEIARLESGAYPISETEFDLASVARTGASIAGSSASGEIDPRIRFQFDANAPPVRADRDAIRQVVVNLVSNALKFTPEEGTITVTTGFDKQEGCFIAVSDTGTGIPEHELPQILRPFKQTESERNAGGRRGCGLGLPICENIARLHEATLRIDSRPDEGTQVRLQFPQHRIARDRAA